MANKFFPNYDTYRVTSPFGPRGSGYHYGIDLVARAADGSGRVDQITAHTGGTVEECGYNSSAGNFVRIRVSADTVMSYCHFRDRLPWRQGDYIAAGTVLGTMGSTGNSTGAHLHWGIKRSGQWIDPAPYLDADYPVDEPAPQPEKTPTRTVTIEVPVILYGDRGEDVRAMQALLGLRGFPCGEAGADGIYGDDTKSALEAFQASVGLPVDAICGALTWPKLLGV